MNMWRGGTLELNPHRSIPEHEEAAQQSLDGDTGRLTISSTVSETKRDSGGAEFLVYKIACVLSGRESLVWVTRRRFSEFYDLHTRLNRMGDVRASLPTRNPFAKMSPSVVHAREQGLMRYLNSVLEHCSDSQCGLLAKFLQVNKQLHKARTGISAATTPASTPFATPFATPAATPEHSRTYASEASRSAGGAASRAVRADLSVAGVPRSSLQRASVTAKSAKSGEGRGGGGLVAWQDSEERQDSEDSGAPTLSVGMTAWDYNSVAAAKQELARDRSREEHRARNDHSREDGERRSVSGGGGLSVHGGGEHSVEGGGGGYSAEMLAGRPTCLVCGEDEEGQPEGGDQHRQEEHPPAASGRAPESGEPEGGRYEGGRNGGERYGGEPEEERYQGGRCQGGRGEGVSPASDGGAAYIHFSSRRAPHESRESRGSEAPARRSIGLWSGGEREARLEAHVQKAGVGLFFAEYDGRAGCVVDEIVAGSAADRHGGIARGDALASVDGVAVAGASLTAVRDRIIGAPGTRVVLRFQQPGADAPFYATLERAAQLRKEASDAGGSELAQAAAQDPLDEEEEEGGGARQRGARQGGDAEGLRLEVDGHTCGAEHGVGQEEEQEAVRAVCSFEASEMHELPLERGDVLEVLRRHASGWWEGRKLSATRAADPQCGWFPSNHVVGVGRGRAPSTQRAPDEMFEGAGLCARPSAAGERKRLSGESSQPEVSAEKLSRHSTVAASPSATSNSSDLSGVSAPATPDSLPAHPPAPPGVPGVPGAPGAPGGGGAARVGLAPRPDSLPLRAPERGAGAPVVAGRGNGGRGIEGLGVEEVCAWLAEMELGEYGERFRENKIDGDLLVDLRDEDLERDFGMSNRYHRLRLLRKLALSAI